MSNTISAFYSSVASLATIKSTEWNTNFNALRGDRIPIHETTQTSADLSYDLGSSTYNWRYGYCDPIGITKTTNSTYTILATDSHLISNVTTAVTWTLPTGSALPTGKKISVSHKNDNSAGQLTIAPGNSETIDGLSSMLLATKDDFVDLMWDGSNWISRNKRIQLVASVKLGSNQVLTGGGGITTVQFDTEIRDTHSAFNTSTYTFTAPESGWYQIIWNGRMDPAGATQIVVYHTVNGTDNAVAAPNVFTSGGYHLNTSNLYYLAASQTILLKVNAVSSNVTLVSGNQGNVIIRRI